MTDLNFISMPFNEEVWNDLILILLLEINWLVSI